MLHLEVVTPNGSVVDAQVDEVVLPGKAGEFTVLEQHVAVLAAIEPGVLRYKSGAKSEKIAISSGFAEVGAYDKVLVLTDDHAFAADIDSAEAQKRLDAAIAALSQWKEATEVLDEDTDSWKEHADYAELFDRVAWAEARIAVTQD